MPPQLIDDVALTAPSFQCNIGDNDRARYRIAFGAGYSVVVDLYSATAVSEGILIRVTRARLKS
jgi:hypothetical protein